MSKYLRDERLRCLSITAEHVRAVNADLQEIITKENGKLKGISQSQDISNKILFSSYVIRFDGQGFRLSAFDEVLKYFSEAKKVERLVYEVSSVESYLQVIGKNVQIWLDPFDENNCFIRVQDDDKDWTDAVFTRLKERFDKYKNYHGLVRNRWVVMAVQVIGVLFGFSSSLWLAKVVTPHLNVNVDNLFFLTFIAIFLNFSNIWGFVLESILKLLDRLWPNISFQRQKKEWLFQGLAVAAVIFLLGSILKWLFALLPKIIR